MSTFAQALARGPIVLDGGLGTLLEARGHDLSTRLWSARLLIDDPGAVAGAHREFFAAGARVAITASYQLGYDALADAGFSRAEADALLELSVRVAQDARAASGLDGGQTWIAASVGPYGAVLADGSEYTGRYGRSIRELRAWHRPRLHALARSGADVLAVETIPSLAEAEAIARELDGLGMSAWLSVTVAGGALRSGDALREVAAIAASTPEIVAVGVNCCAVGDVLPALREIANGADLPLVAYPNTGEGWDAAARSWNGSACDVADSAMDWVAAGARLVGGCCRVGPDEIARIAQLVGARPGAAADL